MSYQSDLKEDFEVSNLCEQCLLTEELTWLMLEHCKIHVKILFYCIQLLVIVAMQSFPFIKDLELNKQFHLQFHNCIEPL